QPHRLQLLLDLLLRLGLLAAHQPQLGVQRRFPLARLVQRLGHLGVAPAPFALDAAQCSDLLVGVPQVLLELLLSRHQLPLALRSGSDPTRSPSSRAPASAATVRPSSPTLPRPSGSEMAKRAPPSPASARSSAALAEASALPARASRTAMAA